jgi:hypothetical protein
MNITHTYTASGEWIFADVSGSGQVTIQCWGAGGNGNETRTGGSGGAYASSVLNLVPGTYVINVGTPDNGGITNVISSSGEIIVQAPGGKSDGTIDHQPTLLTGSITSVGGIGASEYDGYSNYNGSGGGSCGGPSSNGQAGQSGLYAQREQGALGGISIDSVSGNGGAGAFFDAGTLGIILPAKDGEIPGGGAGGAYSYLTETFGTGANGQAIISYDSRIIHSLPTIPEIKTDWTVPPTVLHLDTSHVPVGSYIFYNFSCSYSADFNTITNTMTQFSTDPEGHNVLSQKWLYNGLDTASGQISFSASLSPIYNGGPLYFTIGYPYYNPYFSGSTTQTTCSNVVITLDTKGAPPAYSIRNGIYFDGNMFNDLTFLDYNHTGNRFYPCDGGLATTNELIVWRVVSEYPPVRQFLAAFTSSDFNGHSSVDITDLVLAEGDNCKLVFSIISTDTSGSILEIPLDIAGPDVMQGDINYTKSTTFNSGGAPAPYDGKYNQLFFKYTDTGKIAAWVNSYTILKIPQPQYSIATRITLPINIPHWIQTPPS